MNKVTITGHKKAVEKAERLLAPFKNVEETPESQLRLQIQALIDKHSLKAYIIINGNSVWSRRRILSNLERIRQHGTLYDKEKPRYYPIGSLLRLPAGGKPILSDYFYNFLHSECGSIAHYNIHGWICTYPTYEDLKTFFKKNEHGKRVLDWIPSWKTDAIRIVEAIEQKMFPLTSYVRRSRRNK